MGWHRSIGTLSWRLRRERSAPPVSSADTISTCPRMAAQCSAVLSPCAQRAEQRLAGVPKHAETPRCVELFCQMPQQSQLGEHHGLRRSSGCCSAQRAKPKGKLQNSCRLRSQTEAYREFQDSSAGVAMCTTYQVKRVDVGALCQQQLDGLEVAVVRAAD